MTHPITMEERVFALFKAPFRYEHGHIFDADHVVVSRTSYLSYISDAALLQDKVGELIAKALTEFWEKKS